MSEIITTDVGRFRRVTDGKRKWFLWECRCGEWCNLSEDQMAGRISVDHASQGCKAKYHETHPFGALLLAKVQASVLMDESPTTEDVA